MHTRTNNRGFTLIELAMVLALVGLVLAIFLQAYKIYQQERKAIYDRTVQEKITRSMATYLQVNGHLPCPARSGGVYSDPDFGQATNCLDQTPPPLAAVGTIPVVDLGLPFEMMADAYGNKMLYAVTLARADPSRYATATDEITIQHDDGATKMVPFVIISHGADGKGAYALNSSSMGIDCGSARDSINCDDADYVFADNEYSKSFNVNSPDHYDDSITYSLAQKETTLWLISPSATGVNIANRNTGNVGVGTSTPEEKLHVRDGNLTVDSAGTTSSGDIRINGQLKADMGTLVEATDVEAGTTIYVKENARAGNKMVAKRYCVDIDIEDCE